MNKKQHLFTGWKQVFDFSISQAVKAKNFKMSTVLVAVILFLLLGAVSVFFAFDQLKEDDENVVDIKDSSIKKVYFVSEELSNKEFVNAVIDYVKENIKNVEIVDGNALYKDEKVTKEEGSIVMIAREEKEILTFDFNANTESNVSRGDVTDFAQQFVAVVDSSKYIVSGLDEVQIGLIKFSEMKPVQLVSAKEAAKDRSEAIIALEVLVPMITSLVFYFIILTYGQSVTKLVVAEKSSKLMEMLLTSVKPYGIIFGKVLAMATIGLGQLFLWIVSGVVGFLAGDKIAQGINPEYTNFVLDMIGWLKDNSKDAFSVSGVVLAVLCIILGFLFYCTLAGLSGAVVDKIDDMSSTQLIFQLPMMIGFMVAYFVTFSNMFMSSNSILTTIVRMFPITSPFTLPGEIVIGSATLLEAVIANIILVLAVLGLTIFTGRVYKRKMFNR